MSNYSDVTYNDKQTETSWYKLFLHIPEGARVLDFGCSSGNLGAELKKAKRCTVIGVDIDKDDVRLAAKKLDAAYVKNIEVDDFTKLGKFDIIIFADVLEHLMDPVGTLSKIKKLLTSKGKVLFSIPNMAHMGTRLMLLSGKFGYGETGLLDKTHLHFYDEDEVRRIFNDAGYVIDNLDWTEYYIPQKELKSSLSALGLKPDKAFLENAKKIDAVALQYVGTGTPTKDGLSSVTLPAMSPWIHKTDEYVTMIEKRFEDASKNARHEFEILKTERDRIVTSFSWKITKPLRIANRIKRGLNK